LSKASTVERECQHRRFPPPWFIEDIGGCFVVKASNNRALVFIYYEEGVARRSLTKLLTRDAARRIAAGIAKLAGFVQWLSKGTR
jgi:hypothetical protein